MGRVMLFYYLTKILTLSLYNLFQEIECLQLFDHGTDTVNIRTLLQQDGEQIRLQTPDCNPQLRNCSEDEPESEEDIPSQTQQTTAVPRSPLPASPQTVDASATASATAPAQETCDDVPPEGSVFDCKWYEARGFCEGLQESECRETCGKCSNCEDVPLPGLACEFVLAADQCGENDVVNGGFCQKTCGRCGADSVTEEGLALLALKSRIPIPGQLVSWKGLQPCNSSTVWVGITCRDGYVEEINLGDTTLTNEEGSSGIWTFQNLPKQFVTNAGTAIPQEFSKLVNLRRLELSGVEISKIPVELSTLVKLEVFGVGKNEIKGTLHPEFSVWTAIKAFHGSLNQLSGSLPSTYSFWYQIEYLNLENNQLDGTLPKQYSAWNSIVSFNTRYNQIEGTLPLEYTDWFGTKEFIVSHNSLTGTVPVVYSTLGGLVILGSQENDGICRVRRFYIGEDWSSISEC
eukprot:TRINITY_DN4887_c0_g1_i1.p1 TRINITY_DN4887_c0_g1~~TRINITY_DN4887_c0_g1_i1.p1  ORF type:complete len:460 (-),score=45.46 TRINITY_DN4887_c0_g1_i1:323-1702(-)